MKKETGSRGFKSNLIDEIEIRFPGCEILINDSGLRPGIPDVLILFENKWAMLETKRFDKASKRPNQPYYVDKFNRMSFAAFIYPENKEEILDALEHTFKPRRKSRIFVTK